MLKPAGTQPPRGIGPRRMPIKSSARRSIRLLLRTSARVGGKTWWQWVPLSSTAIYHVIVDTRAAGLVTEFFSGAQPEVWVADRYAGQLGHGAARQMCLAHLLRDANYAIEEGCNGFALEFKWLLLRAISIGRRRPDLKDSTLHQVQRRSRTPARPAAEPPTPHTGITPPVQGHAPRPPRPVSFRHPPRCALYQQCQRARPAPIRDLPQVTGCFRSKWGLRSMPQPLPSSPPDACMV